MRILDLCCGGGCAAIGYKLANKNAVIVGWDVLDMSKVYPFEFHRGDAFALDYEYLAGFDFIHISPPCQAYSKATPRSRRSAHPRLITNALRLGYASGKPFVVENVPGSTAELRPTVTLKAGGKTRHFHTNFPCAAAHFPECLSIMSSSYSPTILIAASWCVPDEYRVLRKHMRQGIPPLMTKHIFNAWIGNILGLVLAK